MDTTHINSGGNAFVFSWCYVLYSIGMIFIGMAIRAAFSDFFQRKIESFIVDVLSIVWWRKSLSLSGSWSHIWHVQSNSFKPINNCEVTLTQWGRSIKGCYKVTDKAGKEFTYCIKGAIENNIYFKGIWYDSMKGNVYQGSFILRIHTNMNHMEGMWMGNSNDSDVKCDKWVWDRMS
ncbi:MAG: hypothetical protein U0T74_14415 [Chitinophagales bacterium]